MKLICIDLFCGLGGWTEAFLAEGYECIGFDIEQHIYGEHRYPAQLVLQDVLTIHGSQFRNAALIVASPPCQEYSYMAMPWARGKQIAAALRGDGEFPEGYTGSRTIEQLNALFNACFRIQREACEAAGRYIPMVVENVKGAQPWVGKAQANFGSFYLWGDVGMVGRRIVARVPKFGEYVAAAGRAQKFNPDGTEHPQGSWFKIADSKERGANGEKVPGFRFDGSGGSFQTAAVNGTKSPGLNWNGHGDPNYKPQGFNVTNAQRYRDGLKGPGGDWFKDGRQGQDACAEALANEQASAERLEAYGQGQLAEAREQIIRENGGVEPGWMQEFGLPGEPDPHAHTKNNGGSWFGVAHNTESGVGQNPVNGSKGTGGSWFTPTEDGRTKQGHWRDGGCVTRCFNSKSDSRKAASAMIAKIPCPLAQYVAKIYKPQS